MSQVASNVVRILVVGECGDGKTTLINAFKHESEQDGETGRRARGITKQIQIFKGKELAPGVQLELWDTPGIGDMDVTPANLLTKIEAALQTDRLSTGGLNGVVVTTPIPDGRVKLGAQVVQTLVDKGFVGGTAKWESIILCGTKLDRAGADDIECFDAEIVPNFFSQAPKKAGPSVKVHKEDYSSLKQALLRLVHTKVQYQAPSSHVVADALASKIGHQSLRMQQEVDEYRGIIAQNHKTITDMQRGLAVGAFEKDLSLVLTQLELLQLQYAMDHKHLAEGQMISAMHGDPAFQELEERLNVVLAMMDTLDDQHSMDNRLSEIGIAKIEVWINSFMVEMVRCTARNGNISTYGSVGSGSPCPPFEMMLDEFLVEVCQWSSACLQHISFHTNKGRSMSYGYLRRAAPTETFQATVGSQIVDLLFSGEEFLDFEERPLPAHARAV